MLNVKFVTFKNSKHILKLLSLMLSIFYSCMIM